MPKIITAIKENKQTKEPRTAVVKRHLTDALKFVVTTIIKNIIITQLIIKEKVAIVWTAWNHAKINQ